MTREQFLKAYNDVAVLKRLMDDLRRSIGDATHNQMMKANTASLLPRDTAHTSRDYDRVIGTMNGYAHDLRLEISAARRALRHVETYSFRQRMTMYSSLTFSKWEGQLYKRQWVGKRFVPRAVLHDAIKEEMSTKDVYIPIDYGVRINRLGTGIITFCGKPHLVVDAIEVKSQQLQDKGLALYRGVVSRGTKEGYVYSEARFAKHLQTGITAAGRSAQQAISHADRDAVAAMLERME